MMNKGICVAGDLIVDILYPTNGWPNEGELVHIEEGISRSTGGCVSNTIVDIARLDPEMPLYAVGKIGADAEGKLIMDTLGQYKNIDLSHVSAEGISALTVVIADEATSQRTFFAYPGANGKFTEEDIDWDRLDCDIFHIGYILLLNALDTEDPEYGSRMAKLLHMAQERGMKTSVDVVSEASDRFKKFVRPALRYCDYCIINEIEAAQTTGITLRDENDELIYDNIPLALKAMKEMGVSTWAVIHSVEGGFGLDENNNYHTIKGLKLPKGYIKGTVGAGDAFCAGVLCGAEKGYTLDKAIELGTASAVVSLRAANATDGMCTEAEAMQIYNELKPNC